MATRYPLIVNSSANQLQEIPFGDTLDLRGNDVNQLVVTGVSTLGIVSAGNIFSTGIVTASTLNVGTGGTIVTTTSGGLVGIRTTVPIQPLQVGSGSSVIVIDTLGELGIGTTNPTSKLQVIGDANISGVVTASGGFNLGISSAGTTVTSGPISTLNFIGAGNTFNVSGTRVDISISASGGSSSQWVSVASGIYTGSNVGIGTTNPTQLLQVGAAGTSSVVVTGIGSVGIGTANPITKLHVVGDINLDDGGSFTTTLQTVTPTAARFVSIPDASGTLALVAGNNGQFVYNNSGSNAGASGFTYNAAPQTLTVSAASTTTNSPILNLSQTWNAGAVEFSGVTLNVTDTASAATSLLQDWQIGGASRFEFLKSGLSYYYNTSTDTTNYERAKFGWVSNVLQVGTEKLGTGIARGLELQTDGTTRVAVGATTGNITLSTAGTVGTSLLINTPSGFAGNGISINRNGVNWFRVCAESQFALNNILVIMGVSEIWCDREYTDRPYFSTNNWGLPVVGSYFRLSGCVLTGDANNVFALRNGTSAQAHRVYNTYTSATNHERGKLEWSSNIFLIGTEKGSGGGTARELHLQTDAITRVAISTTGNVGIGTTTPSSTLDVTGNVRISGITTITGNLNAPGNYYAKIARLTDQTIPQGVDTLIGFSTIADSNNWYTGITTRTTPTISGTYNVTGMVNWKAGSITNNQTNIQLRKNGTSFSVSQVGIQTFSYTQNVSGIVTMNGTTDYIDFTVYTSNPTSQDITGTSDGAWTKLEIFKIN